MLGRSLGGLPKPAETVQRNFSLGPPWLRAAAMSCSAKPTIALPWRAARASSSCPLTSRTESSRPWHASKPRHKAAPNAFSLSTRSCPRRSGRAATSASQFGPPSRKKCRPLWSLCDSSSSWPRNYPRTAPHRQCHHEGTNNSATQARQKSRLCQDCPAVLQKAFAQAMRLRQNSSMSSGKPALTESTVRTTAMKCPGSHSTSPASHKREAFNFGESAFPFMGSSGLLPSERRALASGDIASER